jgi:hypothetical protein
VLFQTDREILIDFVSFLSSNGPMNGMICHIVVVFVLFFWGDPLLKLFSVNSQQQQQQQQQHSVKRVFGLHQLL